MTDEDREGFCLALGGLFYLSASTAYLAQLFLFHQYAWTLVFPAAWGISKLKASSRWVVFLLMVPSLLLMVRITFFNSVPKDMSWNALPGGESILISSKQVEENRQLVALGGPRTADPDGFAVMMVHWAGGGFNHFFNRNFSLRNYIVYPVAFRPYDETELLAKLPSVRAFVIFIGQRGQDDPVTEIQHTFSAETAALILSQFQLDLAQSSERFAALVRRDEP